MRTFKEIKAILRLRYLIRVLQLTGRYMTVETVKRYIQEMGQAIDDATPERSKRLIQAREAAYSAGCLDGIQWQVMDECYVIDMESVSFKYGDYQVSLVYSEGEATLSFVTPNGYMPIMDWTDEGATFATDSPSRKVFIH